MMITTQVSDIARGVPGPRIPVELDVFITGQGWREVGHGVTTVEGVIEDFGEPPAAGVYRLSFDVGSYNPNAFFPSVMVMFEIKDPEENYHIPLFISDFGYSVCRDAAGAIQSRT